MRAMQHVDGNANAGGQIAVAYGVDTYNQTVSDVAIPLRVGNAKDSLPAAMVQPPRCDKACAVAFAPLQGGRSMPVTPESPTLEAGTGNKAPAVLAEAPVQVQWASGGGKVENPTMQALRTSAEHSYQFVRQAMQVRRLTPTECCRLQGFPDDHCDIVFRKKPAADGPKYRALGNSMAVPCMAWLGYRIQLATGGNNT
jgi:hypothetical protein